MHFVNAGNQDFVRTSKVLHQRHYGTREAPMETNELKTMSLEELWKLHEEVIVRLSSILAAEKTKLEERLLGRNTVARPVLSEGISQYRNLKME